MGQSVAKPLVPRTEVPPPNGACPLLATPDVLIQLIFQLLPLQQALRFARCHRVLLHAAASPHAWIHSELVVHAPSLRSVPPLFEDLPVRLQWRNPSHDAPTRDLLEFAENCNLRALDTTHHSCCYNQLFLWPSIYSAPGMHKLVEASIHLPGIGGRIWPVLAQLPLLQTLSVFPDGSLSTAESWEGISSLPGLTCLRLRDPARCARAVCFPSIGRCALLREFDVHANGSFADLFNALPLMDNAQQLQKLTLHGLEPDQLALLFLYPTGFAELSGLRVLSLVSCSRCADVLGCVRRAASLTTLIIQPSLDAGSADVRRTLEATCSSLQLCPNLRAIIRVLSLPPGARDKQLDTNAHKLQSSIRGIAQFAQTGRFRMEDVMLEADG